MKSLSRVRLFAIPWTVAHQAPLSTEFSRQEYWSGLPCPPPGDLLDQGSHLGLLDCRQVLYHLSHQGSPLLFHLASVSVLPFSPSFLLFCSHALSSHSFFAQCVRHQYYYPQRLFSRKLLLLLEGWTNRQAVLGSIITGWHRRREGEREGRSEEERDGAQPV